MVSASPINSTRANGGRAMNCGESRNEVRFVEVIMRAAQSLWPRKTAAELSVRTGISHRACEYWMERKSGMSAESLARLLRTDDGFQILEAIIGDAKPVWWRAFKRQVRRAELRRQQAALAKEIEDNEQSEFDLT